MLKLNGAWLCGLSSVPQGSGLSRLRSSGGLKNTKLRSLTYPQAILFLICVTLMTMLRRIQQINVTGTKEQVVTLPKYLVNGLHFETCTCGADKTNGVPCEHMAAIALSSVMRPQITPINVRLFGTRL
jgi:hypothetical protein